MYTSLKLLPDISNWVSKNGKNMKDMFNGCDKMNVPDLLIQK